MPYNFSQLKFAILFNTQEILPTDMQQFDEELKILVDEANKSGQPIRHYIGFEISGQIHIAYLHLMRRLKLLQDAGVQCTLFLADYHTWLNKKLDGKRETIRNVAEVYFGPTLLQCAKIAGCNIDKIDLIMGRDLYDKGNSLEDSYWTLEQKVGQNFTLGRVIKSITVTGKKESEVQKFALLRYPVMQVSDAFFMQSHLVHAGIDQRKCHVLMREVAFKLEDEFALKIGNKQVTPIAIHEHLLLSMRPSLEGKGKMDSDIFEDNKMSKSKPDSAIWVHDSLEEIQRKLKKAYCPMPTNSQTWEEIEAEQEFNPMLDWCKKMIFPAEKIIPIERPEKFGGNKIYSTFTELKQDYFNGRLHPLDLKNGIAKCLADWFQPIREFTKQNPQGLELVKSIKK